MGLNEQFKTDRKSEVKGIVLDYGDARLTVARAGGANKAFRKAFERATKPYRIQIQTNTLDSEVSDNLLREVFAKTVICGWESKPEGSDEFVKGILAKHIDPASDPKEVLPPTQENMVAVFKNLPDFFSDLREKAMSHAQFVEDTDLGNS